MMEHVDIDRLPPLPPPRSGDHIVVLRGIPWAQYDAICRAREWSSGPRMAYLEGDLEIMSPGRMHEFEKTLIARLIEAYGEEAGLSLNGFGSETYRRKAKEAGAEPDECYSIGHARRFPDLAIEVITTSGGIDKLEIYRRLGVQEVWFWIRGQFWLYRRVAGRYQKIERSALMPDLDLDEITAIVAATDGEHQTEAVRAYRQRLRRR